MRVTYLRTFKGEQIIIPNGNISQVINYTRGGYMAMVTVKVPYTTEADAVLEAVRLAAERACEGDPNVIDPPKLRGVTAFDQYGYEVGVAAKVKALTQWGCEWAIRREILREFAERGRHRLCRRAQPHRNRRHRREQNKKRTGGLAESHARFLFLEGVSEAPWRHRSPPRWPRCPRG